MNWSNRWISHVSPAASPGRCGLKYLRSALLVLWYYYCTISSSTIRRYYVITSLTTVWLKSSSWKKVPTRRKVSYGLSHIACSVDPAVILVELVEHNVHPFTGWGDTTTCCRPLRRLLTSHTWSAFFSFKSSQYQFPFYWGTEVLTPIVSHIARKKGPVRVHSRPKLILWTLNK